MKKQQLVDPPPLITFFWQRIPKLLQRCGRFLFAALAQSFLKRLVIADDFDDALKISRSGLKLLSGENLQRLLLGIDFNGSVGNMMAAVLLGIAEMEQQIRKGRQAAGIKAAKKASKYEGRKAGTFKADVTRAVELKQNGHPVSEIANLLGVSRPTVYNYLKAGKSQLTLAGTKLDHLTAPDDADKPCPHSAIKQPASITPHEGDRNGTSKTLRADDERGGDLPYMFLRVNKYVWNIGTYNSSRSRDAVCVDWFYNFGVCIVQCGNQSAQARNRTFEIRQFRKLSLHPPRLFRRPWPAAKLVSRNFLTNSFRSNRVTGGAVSLIHLVHRSTCLQWNRDQIPITLRETLLHER